MKKLLFVMLTLISIRSLTQTIALNFEKGYYPLGRPNSGCGEGSMCFVGPNFHTFGPNDGNTASVQMRATHGCIGSYPGRGLLFNARHEQNGQWVRGAGMLIAYNFLQGITYKISTWAVFRDDIAQTPKLFPSLQLQVTNTPIDGTLCTVSAEPIDIFSATNPYSEVLPNNTNNQLSHSSFTFTASDCFSYLWIASKPNSNGESDGSIDIREIDIETLTSPLSITGLDDLCTGSETYSLVNYPPGSSIVWSLSPFDLANYSPNNDQVLVTKKDNGKLTLTATITTPCGIQLITNKSVRLGEPPAPGQIDMYGNGADDPLSMCPGNYRAEAYFTDNFAQYEWLLPSGWTSSVSNGNNPFITNSFDIPINVQHLVESSYIRVRAINSCGYGSPNFLIVNTNCDGFGSNIVTNDNNNDYTLYPNPAKSEIKITLSSKKKLVTKESASNVSAVRPNKSLLNQNIELSRQTKAAIQKITIYDVNGNLKKIFRYSQMQESLNINVSQLPKGYYFVDIFNGKKTERKTLFIEH